MDYREIQRIINTILCDIKTLKTSIVKKISILFNSTEIELDVTSINFTGSGVESVTTDNGVTTVQIEGGTPLEQVQSNFTELNGSLPSFIQNKPIPIDLVFTGNCSTTQTSPTEITVNIFDTSTLEDYADDTAAAIGGIAINEIYRTGSILKVRIS